MSRFGVRIGHDHLGRVSLTIAEGWGDTMHIAEPSIKDIEGLIRQLTECLEDAAREIAITNRKHMGDITT